jgi:hypothetical protein
MRWKTVGPELRVLKHLSEVNGRQENRNTPRRGSFLPNIGEEEDRIKQAKETEPDAEEDDRRLTVIPIGGIPL